MNWLHFSFALGALVSPFLYSFLLGSGFNWPILYYVFVLSSAAVAYSMRDSLRSKPIQTQETSIKHSMGHVLQQPFYWLLLLAIFLYTASEVGLSGWIPTLLTQVGLPANYASLGVSALWLGISLGRAFCARISGIIGARRLLVLLTGFSCLTMFPFVWPLHPTLQLILIFAAGFSLSGIFPLILLEATDLLPGYSDVTTSGLMVAASFGGAAGPAVLGLIGEYYSLTKGIVALAGFMLLATVSILLVPHPSSKQLAPATNPATKETN